MSKRILALLLTMCVVFSFSGCGSRKEAKEDSSETVVEESSEESEKKATLVNKATYSNGDSELNCVANLYEDEGKIVWTFIYKATDEQDATDAYEMLCLCGGSISKTLNEIESKYTTEFGSAIVSLPDGRYIMGTSFMKPLMATNSDGTNVYMAAPDWYDFLNADRESDIATFISDSVEKDFFPETIKK